MRQNFQSTFKDGNGRVIGSATTANGVAGNIAVYLAGTTTAASIYAASSGGIAVNSVSTDTHGYFYFWVDPKDYGTAQLFKIVLSHSDFESKTYDNLKIFPDNLSRLIVDSTETDQGVAGNGFSVKDLVDSIGSNSATITFAHNSNAATTTYTFSTDETIPSNINVIIEKGAILSIATAITLTIIGPPEIGLYQVFSGAGSIVFGASTTAQADWWGRDAAAVTAALAACPEGSTIKMGGGLWDFGASGVTSTISGGYNIEGVGYSDGSEGTYITTSNAFGAFLISGQHTISKLRIYASGAYGMTLGNGGDSPVAFTGKLQDVKISGAATAGLRANGIQLGALENVWLDGNNIGLAIDGAGNTGCILTSCKIRNNTAEGILYDAAQTASKFTYLKCYIEANGNSGLKSTSTLANTSFRDCWFESNAKSGTTYYDLEITATGNDGVLVDNCYFNNITTPATNKAIKFAGNLTLKGNIYVGHTAPYVWYGQANAKLYSGDISIAAESANLQFDGLNNYFKDLLGRNTVVAFTANHSLHRYYSDSLTATNSGASGAILFTLPVPVQGLEISFVIAAAQTITITPNGKQILGLTDAVGDRIQSAGTIGNNITLRATSTTQWIPVSVYGTWNDIN